jgi:hypothetical protein
MTDRSLSNLTPYFPEDIIESFLFRQVLPVTWPPCCVSKVLENVDPKSDHVERSELAKRFFIVRWERERAKRAKREAGRAGA